MKKLITLCFVLILHLPTVLLQCDRHSWRCKNDECISEDLLCDGKADCKDSSDETATACLGTTCPKYSFRCAYGACISGDLKCNGHNDCHDKSDETSRECPDSSLQNKNNCSPGMFKCDDGTCIADEKGCDGKADCPDKSDETSSTCASANCPAFAFKCAYGACVYGDAKCDGKKDCIDGSDENLCGPTTTIMPSSAGGCFVDNIPYLQVILSASNEDVRRGTYVKSYEYINYKCPKNYFLEGLTTNFCLDKSWLNAVPKCTKYCPPIQGLTIQPTCEFNKQSVACNRNIKPGTKAKIACNTIYEKPDRPVKEDLYCLEDGDWDFSPFRCEQTCGEKPATVTPFILNGKTTDISEVPWHVAIYSNLNGPYEQICGGTIITPKIVISAAHCFWNDQLRTVYNKSYYTVAAGKMFRQYDAAEPNEVQFTNISDILVPQTYNGINYNYHSDLAVLALNNNIRYNYHIRPACVEWVDFADRYIASEIIGIVAGWGLDESSKSSSKLLSVELPTVGKNECQNKVNPDQKILITSDKFCIDSRSGANVCSGDSGGGFLVPKKIKNVDHYYLWGVVSNGLVGSGQCDGNFVTTFTNIQYYKELVVNGINDNRS